MILEKKNPAGLRRVLLDIGELVEGLPRIRGRNPAYEFHLIVSARKVLKGETPCTVGLRFVCLPVDVLQLDFGGADWNSVFVCH
jgi:hypothetical protein